MAGGLPGISGYEGAPALTFSRGERSTRLFDGTKSLPVNKASNPVQEKEEKGAKTSAGFEEMKPSLGVCKEKEQEKKGGIV